MQQNLASQIQSGLLIGIIALLSVIMGVVGFGAPSTEGCNTDGPSYAAQVYDVTLTEGDFNAAFTVTSFNRYPTERAQTLRLREYTMDGLVERALLVREARRLGFTADPEEVMQRVASEERVLIGGPIDAPAGYPTSVPAPVRDNQGNRSRTYLRNFIQHHLRRSVQEFADWQVEETLAERVRDAVGASASVSPREVWDGFVQERERARLSYVRFDPSYYEAQVDATDEAVAAWMEENSEAVDAEYRRQRHRYTNLPEQTRARHILIPAAEDASEEDRASARTRAETLLEQVQNGGDFAALARENSSDESSAVRGGDLGWFPRGRMVEAFTEASFGTEPGNVVDHLVETPYGFHIIEVQGRREGDVDEDEAKRELSEGLFREARAAELAEAEARRALEYARGEHTMEELDERLLARWTEPTEQIEPTDGDTEATPAETPERDAAAPQVRETRSFGRTESPISGLDTGDLVRQAFEMTLDEPLPEEPIQLGTSWVVYRLIERQEATEDAFDEETRNRIEGRLLDQKRRETVSAYVGRLRAQAEADGELRINAALLSYGSAASEDDESAEE